MAFVAGVIKKQLVLKQTLSWWLTEPAALAMPGLGSSPPAPAWAPGPGGPGEGGGPPAPAGARGAGGWGEGGLSGPADVGGVAWGHREPASFENRRYPFLNSLEIGPCGSKKEV